MQALLEMFILDNSNQSLNAVVSAYDQLDPNGCAVISALRTAESCVSDTIYAEGPIFIR